ncbi:carbon-nitrogen hydrolase family protein [Oceanibacterium hippocampi]|uniref:(R)-stereoselective amidase n=1 Tax=Oceanibacterium hippocampi TaxID=745714 RepID=A0A1Y5THS0_9PROT|nr:carbon-nitrogen hydrolase family protein [Oceanibacterium hippocampi]SLN64250.1 (R)-stereoselective amidase [Oceanibacterium hippocampi]
MGTETRLPAGPVRVAAGQMHCVPGDVDANLATIEALAQLAARDGVKLLVVPEMATTGYFIADRLDGLAEPEDGPTAIRLAAIAKAAGLYLTVGFVLADGGKIYDAQLLFGPEGRRLATYRKAHLFSAEREWFSAGDTPMVVETDIGRIGLTICYDLLFPEYVRRLVDLGADIILNSTNWITNDFQRDVWGWSGPTVQSLAATRALENGVWLAMASCVGPEWEFDSIGHSCVVAPSGRILASLGHSHGIAAADVVYHSDDLDRWKAVATYLADRRPELYR